MPRLRPADCVDRPRSVPRRGSGAVGPGSAERGASLQTSDHVVKRSAPDQQPPCRLVATREAIAARLVETAMGTHALALLAALDTACTNVAELGEAAAELFRQHPDYTIITSFPGLADSTSSGVLAEIGDDRTRFADARALRPTPAPHPSPERPDVPSRSPTDTSRTTASPPSAGCGRLHRHRELPNRPATIIGACANTATATPPPTDTCSTNSSDSSTTAYNTDRPSTKPKHSRRRFATPRPSGQRPATRRPCTSA